jgi:lysophospholipase L1-like esterase
MIGLALLGTTLLATATAGELVLRMPAVARQLGTLPELRAWDTRYDGLWKHNIFNFRSPYERVARRPGVVRILALGDSYTWGDMVASSDSVWPAELERLLDARYPGIAFEVINMGHKGFTTRNEAELLRRLGWQFDPDLVLIQFLSNDPMPSGPNLTYESTARYLHWHHLLPARFSTGWVRHSALSEFLTVKLNVLLEPTGTRYSFPLFRNDFVGWQQMQDALRDVADSSAARQTPVALVVFPMFIAGRWTARDFPERPLHDKVERLAASLGLHTQDLTPAYAAKGGNWKRWWAMPYDMHPGPAAQALAARTIANALQRAPWFTPRAWARNSLGAAPTQVASRVAPAKHAP